MTNQKPPQLAGESKANGPFYPSPFKEYFLLTTPLQSNGIRTNSSDEWGLCLLLPTFNKKGCQYEEKGWVFVHTGFKSVL
jgi:hypothetical protein